MQECNHRIKHTIRTAFQKGKLNEVIRCPQCGLLCIVDEETKKKILLIIRHLLFFFTFAVFLSVQPPRIAYILYAFAFLFIYAIIHIIYVCNFLPYKLISEEDAKDFLLSDLNHFHPHG